MFSVYILYSKTADRYYVGHSANVKSRLSHHNASLRFGEYTRKNGPWTLVYEERDFHSRSEAMRREREIKGWKSRKKIEKLIHRSVGRVPMTSGLRD
ncbi:MAG: GIY-YIG nuclease family protein [Chitinispirillaceae bacterium]|nr:GIY-YIG nuclease family protein [Chitinispirillaceae bacterium]